MKQRPDFLKMQIIDGPLAISICMGGIQIAPIGAHCNHARRKMCATVRKTNAQSEKSETVHSVLTLVRDSERYIIRMPRKLKLLAHLSNQNAKQRRVASSSRSDAAQIGGESVGNLAEEPVVSDDSDDEIPYWPAEDHNSAVIEAEDAHRLLLKWVPEAESAIRKPHIVVSRWTNWRRNKEIENRAKQMAGNPTLLYLWKVDCDAGLSIKKTREGLCF